MIFEEKNFSHWQDVSVESINMNKQTYALRVKLASMTDAKKIAVLKLKIQQIEKNQK